MATSSPTRVPWQAWSEKATGYALVVARTPPSRALYHRFGNPLFLGALHAVSEQGAQCVVLARHSEQRAGHRAPRPSELTDAGAGGRLALADAGGRPCTRGGRDDDARSGAARGTDVHALRGRAPAVDRWLEERGALSRLEDVSQLVPVRPRAREPHDLSVLRERADGLIGVFTEAVLTWLERRQRSQPNPSARLPGVKKRPAGYLFKNRTRRADTRNKYEPDAAHNHRVARSDATLLLGRGALGAGPSPSAGDRRWRPQVAEIVDLQSARERRAASAARKYEAI